MSTAPIYTEKDLVRIAKRENNTKRTYLVVNQLQGKHIPVRPGEALQMFGTLADLLNNEYRGERLLFIGFAETATAIGAAAAIAAGAAYIQTTREMIPNVEYLFFFEEHSHAAEQKLVRTDLDSVMETIDRIIFIEDEVTTGKTILNGIDILEKTYGNSMKFSVASLLNGMDEHALRAYRERNINLHYLVKTNHAQYSEIASQFSGNGTYVSCNVSGGVSTWKEMRVNTRVNARRLTAAEPYRQACVYLWSEIDKRLHNELLGKTLVLGTEEFMYPALYVANEMEKLGMDVRFHATTRSPIAVSSERTYPLHTRYELRSMYDKDRVTYLYDIDAYDTVLIISDAPEGDTEGLYSLVNALKMKNDRIYVVWC